MKISVGLIGCGYWGPNLLRNFYSLPNCQVTRVVEIDQNRVEYLLRQYPSLSVSSHYQDVFSSDIDAVVIATPAKTHYALAKAALEKHKHVLVEKPLALTASQAQELIDLSKRNHCQLMVGHTFEYNAAVQYLKKAIDSGVIGKPYYLYAQRLNLGIVRQDINALWNLAPHDVSILIYLLGKIPVAVSATGKAFLQPGIEDVVFMTIHFPDDVLAHVQVSWLDPGKVRKLTVVGSEKMIVYDDVADAKIQVYEKGIKKQNISDSLGRYDDFGKFQLIRVAGDVLFPKINFTEPLKVECEHFLECIAQNQRPRTDGNNGLRVVKVLETAQKSLEQNGKLLEIK